MYPQYKQNAENNIQASKKKKEHLHPVQHHQRAHSLAVNCPDNDLLFTYGLHLTLNELRTKELAG